MLHWPDSDWPTSPREWRRSTCPEVVSSAYFKIGACLTPATIFGIRASANLQPPSPCWSMLFGSGPLVDWSLSSAVIASAAKRSTDSGGLDCFVAPFLAMTAMGHGL